MKLYYAIILCSLLAGCAAKQAHQPIQATKVSGFPVAAADMPKIRTSETVKAYPVGRYTDPNFPEEMHERHTLYRREQSADWNYRPSKLESLPLGPVVAISNPSPSYYMKTDAEQINAQQKAYADALLEQNRVMKKQIDELQKNDSIIQGLQNEVEQLKRELNSKREPSLFEESKPESTPTAPNDFSFRRATPNDEDAISDPSEIMFFPSSEADYQAFLVSQMRLNDELTAQLESLERRRIEVVLSPFFPSRRYLAFTNQNIL